MLRTILFLLLCFSTAQAQAPESEYALLWEITHEEQIRPSYLFGTMHVQDENVFKLPDSVLIGISSCDGFATEVAFDEAMNEVVSWAISNQGALESKPKSRNFNEELEDLLSKKATTADPLELFGNIGDDYTAGEEQETFLDAWLYRVARDEGKVVGGLESIQDQMVLLLDEENLFGGGSGRVGIDFLKAAYVKGDLKAIEAFMASDEVTDAFRDEVLTKRNYTMARVGDSLIQIRPTFMAVGAGHLPGEEGVIALLRKEGYRLRRVMPNYSGLADTYRQRPYKPQWQTFEDLEMGLRVDVPAKPFAVPIEDLATMQFGMDLPGGFFYAFYRMQLPVAIPAAAQKETISQVIMGMGSEISERSDVTQGKFTGEEIFADAEGFTFRVRILFDDESMLFTLVGISDKAVRSETAERFMNSIETFDPPSLFSKEWKAYSYDQGGFTGTFPSKPIYTYDPEMDGDDLSIRSYSYESKDAYYGHTVGIRISEQSIAGSYPPDSTWIAGMMDDLEWKSDEEEGLKMVTRHGLGGWEMHGTFDGSETWVRQVNQGFKSFLLFLTGKEDSLETLVDDYFNAFDVMPLRAPDFSTPFSGDGFSLQLPSKPVEDLESWSYFLFPGADREDFYMGRDSLSTLSFQIENFSLSPYFRANNPDSLLWEYVDFLGDDPEVGPWNSYAQDGYWIVERAEEKGGGALVEHQRLYLDGESVKEFSISIPQDLDAPLAASTFFNSIQLEKKSDYQDLLKPKGKMMLSILEGDDVVEMDNVLDHLYDYEMAPGELELFMDWFSKHTYAEDRKLGIIAELITGKDNDSSNAWVAKHFSDLDGNPNRQLNILQLLLDSPRRMSQVLGEQLFYAHRPKSEDVFLLQGVLSRMVELNPKLYQEKHRLAAWFDNGHYFETLGEDLLGHIGGESWSVVEGRAVLDQMAGLIEETALAKKMSEGSAYLEGISSYYRCLSYVEATTVDKAASQALLLEASLEVQTAAARGMLAQGWEVDSKKLRELAAVPGYGYDILTLLISEDRIKELPKKYFKPANMARQYLLHTFPLSGETAITKLEFLEKGSLIYDGDTYDYYVYKTGFRDNPDWYLGFSGLFSKDHKLGLPEIENYSFSSESYHPSRLEEMISDFETEVRSMRFEGDW